MSTLELIPTIEDEDEVELEESDSEEEVLPRPKKRLHRSSVFAEGFEFPVDGGQDLSWDMDDAIHMAANSEGSQFASLDAKIARAREIRKLKAEQSKETKMAEKNIKKDSINGKKRKKGSQTPPTDSESSEEGGGGEESSSEDDDSDLPQDEETASSSRAKEKEAFFDEPPSQLSDISFTDMNLSRPLLKAVTSLGFVTPTPIQASAIPLALLGKDICACATTGSGKTAAFMLPILERLLFRPGLSRAIRVLVLVPTRELAIQVHSVGRTLARHSDIQLCLATGGLESKGQEAALRKSPDIVIATPGRLVDHLRNAPSFSLQTIEILVLDEADRMLDEHFADQMNEIIQLCPKGRQTMLFSATMTDEVEELSRLSLNHPVRLFVDSNTDLVSTLQQEFVRIKAKKEGDREAIVTALCCRTFQEHCLVFLPTKRLAHRMRIICGLQGLRASELHGSLTQLQRLESLEQFKKGEVDVLLATDLAARGLDIERVKTVLNYAMPPTVKQYIHRVGRTARAGRTGRAVTLVGEKGRKVLKEVVKQAKLPVKSRILLPEVVVRYRDKIRKMEPEIREILKQEEEEKQLRISEMEVNKAKNLIEYEKEIFSRPARTWRVPTTAAGMKAAADARPQRKRARTAAKGKKKKQAETPQEKASREAQQRQEFASRVAKRARKQKKIYAVPPEDQKPRSPRKVKPQPVIRAFDRELTDTSKKALKDFRRVPLIGNSSTGSKFKSKKRYKRR